MYARMARALFTGAFARSALSQLRSAPLSRNLPYALGRFPAVRKTYGQVLGLAQRLGAVPGMSGAGASLFPDLDVAAAAEALARRAVVSPLRLPTALVAELEHLCRNAELVHWGNGERFRGGDVVDGRRPSGAYAVLADVADAQLLAPARRVAEDPKLLTVISQHIGYRPIGAHVRVLWSFVSAASEADRHAVGQTVDWHFDVHSYNFVYANFYVTNVDADSGAHEMIAGSHTHKPARWLLASARRSDADIAAAYPNDRLTLVGPPGTGFLQDSSCYHRVLVPTARERLMLHIRYY